LRRRKCQGNWSRTDPLSRPEDPADDAASNMGAMSERERSEAR
jgi:hypothetical protein